MTRKVLEKVLEYETKIIQYCNCRIPHQNDESYGSGQLRTPWITGVCEHCLVVDICRLRLKYPSDQISSKFARLWPIFSRPCLFPMNNTNTNPGSMVLLLAYTGMETSHMTLVVRGVSAWPAVLPVTTDQALVQTKLSFLPMCLHTIILSPFYQQCPSEHFLVSQSAPCVQSGCSIKSGNKNL